MIGAIPIMLAVLPAVLAGAIVCTVFVFKKRWCGQALMGIAVAGGLFSSILGIARLLTRAGHESVGAVLLLGGLVVIAICAIAITMTSDRGRNPSS